MQHQTQKSLFCRNVRLFDLSAEKTSWKAKHSRHEYLGTQTAHFDTASAPRPRQLSIRCAPLSGRNVIPHLYSYSGLIYIFTAPFILIVIPKAELILN